MTESQKLDVLDRLFKLWMCNKELRFGQLIANWYAGEDLYYMEDLELITKLEIFYYEKVRK